MNHKIKLNKLLKKSGRKRNWICEQLDMHRSTFWRKVNSNNLTAQELEKIKKIINK